MKFEQGDKVLLKTDPNLHLTVIDVFKTALWCRDKRGIVKSFKVNQLIHADPMKIVRNRLDNT